jgi:glycosyltransferase involved in cell wall biosynthesis
MRTPLRVLFICHNHPSVRPGGAEAYALELHRHLDRSGDFESYFLAKGGPPLSQAGRPHAETHIAPVGGRTHNEYFLYTDGFDYDWVMGTVEQDKSLYTEHFRRFIRAVRPDVVHLHHTMFLGYEILREIRNSVPAAPIVYTLHEFMPICHRQGQMLRRVDDTPCLEESPRRCHECFPELSPQTFFLRKRFVQSQFALVDRFIAPSRFLAERYVDWGIPADRIEVEEYGRTTLPEAEPAGERPFRDRFGYFGQLTPFKGLQVLLEAMSLLVEDGTGAGDPLVAALELAVRRERRAASVDAPRPHLWVHGANLDLQPGEFRTRIEKLFQATERSVTWVGRYDHSQLAELFSRLDWIVVPSIWWENSPLVIQEAFHFKKPVICSDIGGMAEKVQHEVNGLHFRAGDAQGLAATLRRAVETPGLWEQLRANIAPVYAMQEHVERLAGLYTSLIDSREVVHA